MCASISPIKQYATPRNQDIKKKLTILVIEDDEPVLKTNKAILERLGYNVLMAKTGQETIAIANTFNGDIDLAMLDMQLPDAEGNIIYPLLMQILPDLKVIICSGLNINNPVAQKILDAGAEGFLQKPFTMSALSNKLAKRLRAEQ